MHPLEICEFDPALIDNLNIYDTKELMTQLCINKMKLGMEDPKEVFNDEDFVNKVRFYKTSIVSTVSKDERSIWDVSPSIDKCTFYIIPELLEFSPGTYACKSTFSGKTYIEHFIILNSLVPYMSFRVCLEQPYANGIYSCIQSFLDVNKLEDVKLVKYLICDSDPLIMYNEDILIKNLRVSMESIKRLAYV